MDKPTVKIKRKLLFFLVVFTIGIVGLMFRIAYLQIAQGDFLQELAYEQHTRDRLISPQRGTIYDRNGVALAKSATVTTIGVIHAQIEDAEQVARVLSEKLNLDYETVKKKVDKVVALERIQSKVDKEVADEIRKMNLPGVKIDEDSKRYYPYSNLASHVIGFVGKDNQGIIGLEVKYDEYLRGTPGKILTETDGKGRKLKNSPERRIEPIPGNHLVTTIDLTIQQYAEQALDKAIKAKDAKRGSIIVMNPQTGEIYAMANKPDYDLNQPFKINNPELEQIWSTLNTEEQYKELNKMWRNFAINDTYEPGSTFKIMTSAMGLEEMVVNANSPFNCNGYHTVAGRMIKCWRYPRAHGSQTFTQGVQNSCNPVFMQVAERIGVKKFYQYMKLFGFSEKTGIDVPGEAVGIMHNLKDIGPVELATMSFGQSFQITPLQLLRAAAAVVNGGTLITPHFGSKVINDEGEVVKEFEYKDGKQIISQETSDTMKKILESVVAQGTGNKAYIPGYRIGGKTATSEKLPRSAKKYIASFLAFAPSENPQVMALVIIDEPQGIYYGGTVAGPVMKEILDNILPYLKIEPKYTEVELKMDEVEKVRVPNLISKNTDEAIKELKKINLGFELIGNGKTVKDQFPLSGEEVNPKSKVILYTNP
ncbi:penicillin-binding transpeptidase domain-containing protein [Defluviitalea saccharophila]|uniref:Penicillin-binding transpeptidase domain-containing protein n=1 Tax=Defluviitalea saccharophila TaxID=879970 RepID=A0ABZ2Y4G2_9FIRM|nr:PASTA domain-containing protein [Candidatus Epulonipiscium sp.]